MLPLAATYTDVRSHHLLVLEPTWRLRETPLLKELKTWTSVNTELKKWCKASGWQRISSDTNMKPPKTWTLYRCCCGWNRRMTQNAELHYKTATNMRLSESAWSGPSRTSMERAEAHKSQATPLWIDAELSVTVTLDCRGCFQRGCSIKATLGRGWSWWVSGAMLNGLWQNITTATNSTTQWQIFNLGCHIYQRRFMSSVFD